MYKTMNEIYTVQNHYNMNNFASYDMEKKILSVIDLEWHCPLLVP